LRAVENGEWEVKESNGRVEWIKVKYTFSGDTLRNPFEHQLNINNKGKAIK
jgi:hypothetical protein